jgi:hypothetical protein
MCVHMWAHTYMRECCPHDHKLRGSLSKPPLVGATRQSDFLVSTPKITLQAYASEKYRCEFYKKGAAIGVKRKFGDKKQCMSFRCKTSSEEHMRSLGDDCMRKLDGGETEVDVKKWVNEQVE